MAGKMVHWLKWLAALTEDQSLFPSTSWETWTYIVYTHIRTLKRYWSDFTIHHPTDLGMTDKHIERYVRNGEMLTETMNYHCTSNRMAKVQNRGKGVELRGAFPHSGGNTKWYSHSGAPHFHFKILKTHMHCSAILLNNMYLKVLKINWPKKKKTVIRSLSVWNRVSCIPHYPQSQNVAENNFLCSHL